MKIITVNINQAAYPVLIGKSMLNQLQALLKKQKLFNNLFIVIDQNVFNHHHSKIKSVFSGYREKIHYAVIPSGEKTKSDKELSKIYSALLNNNFGRDTTLIAIGGGVTGDIAGYAAATYMRGIQLVLVPTTLLAMIDSSIGGKTGINLKKRKNIIGAFFQPKLVINDINFLSTLPNREFDSALGELVKYGLISNNDFYSFLSDSIGKIKTLNKKSISYAIIESISIKAGVVSQDEFERKGIRKILNFGHTFAHAIESSLRFRVKHGEAVIAGILCALLLSNKIGLLHSSKLKKLLQLPCSIQIPPAVKRSDNQEVFEAMINDKKNRNEKILFVLMTDVGKIIVDVPANKKDIFYSLNKMKEL
jgi:3-dehydroquinate synthase